ncbi:hypothetical protein CMI47_04135 [Candidatus Pacearchaeota archaeon]|jgi:hypothetical protein|nr:hypothetical protein [Candidatus Pacearchaeota archaeon]
MMKTTYNDGGREDAGYKGKTGDCGTRAIAIATGLDYQDVYDMIIEYAKKERTGKRKKKISHPRTGVYVNTMKKIMEALGWKWKATMGIGTGCTVHLNPDELPKGRIICRVSRHYVAVVDGEICDTHDCSRNGGRCVYGYWYEENA